MNKNLIIIGCQRAGKTTLANMLCNSSNHYNLISVDALIHAFDLMLPEQGISFQTSIKEKSKILAPFLAEYCKRFTKAYPNQNFLIESCQLLPADLVLQPKFKEADIICLGYPNANPNDFFSSIRENDKKISKPYTSLMSDEQLLTMIPKWINYSNYLQEEALKLGIPFYETDKNRNNILSSIATNLANKNLSQFSEER